MISMPVRSPLCTVRSKVWPANAFWWIVPSGLRSKKQPSSFSSSRMRSTAPRHQQPRELLVVEPVAALDRVHEMALDRVARRERDVVAALHHARAAAFAEQALHRDGDVESRDWRCLRVQRREQPRAAGAEDQDVGVEPVHPCAVTSTRRCAPRTAARRGGAPRRSTSRVERAAVRIHRHQQRTEAADAELPQAFGIEIVEIDVLDRLDPGRLAAPPRRRRSRDRRRRGRGTRRASSAPHAALADDDAHAVALHQRPREALHARDRGRADADRRVAGRVLRRRFATRLHVRRGVDDRMALAGRSRVVRPRSNMWISVASRMPNSVPFERDGVADAERAHLRLGDRHLERRGEPCDRLTANAIPPGVMTALARRAEWHWMFTATGFIVMCVAAISTCTRNAVERPPRPCGPMPSSFTASRQLAPRSSRPPGSAHAVPSGRVAAILARCMHRSDVPPMPTPTMVGGQTRPPHSITRSMTKRLTAFDAVGRDQHLAGTSRSPSPSLSGSSRSRPSRRARSKSMLMIGTRDAARGLLVLARDRMHDRGAQRMLARRALAAAADRLLHARRRRTRRCGRW